LGNRQRISANTPIYQFTSLKLTENIGKTILTGITQEGIYSSPTIE